jgi:hypothetical protein
VACACACGKSSQPPSSEAERQWVANTAGIIDQLQRDLRLESDAGDTIADARETLRSGLYTVLVAYTDFGGCRHMVAAAGAPPERFAKVRAALAAACKLLQRSAVLFTRAVKHDDPATLLEAGRTASAASPLLVQAEVELQAAATSR